MNLTEIKTKYNCYKTTDDKYEVFDKYDYSGYLTKEKTKWFYHGLPMDAPIQVKNLTELTNAIEHFRTRCEEEWTCPQALSPSIRKCCVAESALGYIAKRLKWSTKTELSPVYVVRSGALGAKLFEISSEMNFKDDTCIFHISYNGGWTSTSPKFTDYYDALNWIRSVVSSTYITVGTDFLAVALNNDMCIKPMQEVVMSKIQFSGNGVNVVDASLNDHLIEILENTLASLKQNKN